MASNDTLDEKYQAAEFVGQGTFGVIASVTCRQTGDSRAIKLVDCNDPSLVNEINLLSQPDYHHESIIRYYGSWLVETDTFDASWKSVLTQKYRRGYPRMMIAIELELCNGE